MACHSFNAFFQFMKIEKSRRFGVAALYHLRYSVKTQICGKPVEKRNIALFAVFHISAAGLSLSETSAIPQSYALMRITTNNEM